jgi:hypothetical protein
MDRILDGFLSGSSECISFRQASRSFAHAIYEELLELRTEAVVLLRVSGVGFTNILPN